LTTPLAGLVEEEERLEGGAKVIAGIRLLLATLAIAVTATLQAASEGGETAVSGHRIFGWHPVYLAAVVYCFVDVAYLFLLRYARAAQRVALLVASGLAVDILVGAGLVLLTGGHESAFLPLLFVWIIAAGTVLSGRMAFGASSLAVVCLSLALILRHFGLYPGGVAGRPEATSLLWRGGAFHLAQSGAFFMVAYLAGALSRHLAAAQLVADQVLASMQEGLVVLDRDLRVRFSNPEAARLLDAELPRGTLAAEALAGERLELVRRMLTARGKFGPALVELPAPDGEEPATVAISGTPVRSPRGAFRGLIAVISDRKAERQLEQAQRLAEQRRVLSELAMSIAHEIRNPLGAVRSAVQEIGGEADISDGGRELVDVVLSESDRLDRIVTDFLTFARPRPPNAVPVRLRNLVAETQETVARGAGDGSEIRLVNDVAPETQLTADAELLRQALLNLGLNAAAAIDGSGTIRASTCSETLGEFGERMSPARRARQAAAGLAEAPASRPGVVVELSDDGAGMDAETLRRAGEPFFTTRAGGTGLGLAIVERVAAAHGGAVDIESTPGAGTKVRMWFPAREEGDGNG
jgi:two-component system sensor histidine kinase PilS (NtrC family)